MHRKEIVEYIKKYVTLGELLKKDKAITYNLNEEQYSCKFHGEDRKKSARYYKSTDSSYCWVCKESFDVIKYVQRKENLSFNDALSFLCKEYNIDISNIYEFNFSDKTEELKQEKKTIDDKKLKLEKIRNIMSSIKKTLDWDVYLKVVYVYMSLKYVVSDTMFDKIYYDYKNKIIELVKGKNNG